MYVYKCKYVQKMQSGKRRRIRGMPIHVYVHIYVYMPICIENGIGQKLPNQRHT